MGEFYYIEIETERTLVQCQEILLKDIQHEILDNTPLEITTRTPYFMLKFRQLADDHYAYSSAIDLNPTIQILMFNFFRKNTDSIPMIYRCFLKWVHASDDTAILLYEGEIVLFLSKDRELMCHSDPNHRRGDLNEIIDEEYAFKAFPIL